jgi:hypothetical protein
LREVEALTFSDIRLIDGGKVVSPTCRPLFTPRKIDISEGRAVSSSQLKCFLLAVITAAYSPPEGIEGSSYLGEDSYFLLRHHLSSQVLEKGVICQFLFPVC